MVFVVLLTLSFPACWQSGKTPESAAPAADSQQAAKDSPGRAAPTFALKDAAGKEHRLEDFKGQPVVLHFWASWCAPCVDEFPQWLATARAYEGKPGKWLAISLDESWDDARKILNGVELPKNVVSVLDPERKTPEAFGSFEFPESYLLTSDLKIAQKWVGAQKWDGPAMRGKLDAVIR
jgi:thiol-disulfide isomerase/thioredoxin